MLGLALFSKTNRLEARVNAILTPGRPLEVRPRPMTRRLVLVATCALLLTSVLVRFERAAAAPPAAALADSGRRVNVLPKKAAIHDAKSRRTFSADARVSF